MDEIDKKIIAQLKPTEEQHYNELAKIIGYTSMGTKKRLEKLVKNGTIKISALLNPTALGLHPAIVMLEMENAQAMQNLLDRFKDCPRVIQIFKTVGGFNLIALVVAENPETLESISMEKCSMRSGPGIRTIRILPHKRHILLALPANKRKLGTQRNSSNSLQCRLRPMHPI